MYIPNSCFNVNENCLLFILTSYMNTNDVDITNFSNSAKNTAVDVMYGSLL